MLASRATAYNWEDMQALTHSEANYEVGQHYDVFVTHINNPHSFYIRSVLFHNVMVNLEEPGHKTDVVHPGLNVIYKSQTCSKYVRGYITAVGINNARLAFTVFASDYGFTDFNVPKEDMTKPAYNNYIPPLAIHCELYLCAPKDREGFSDLAINAMKYYTGSEVTQMTIKDKSFGKIVVQLNNTCPDDIATMLALTEYTHLTGSPNSVYRFMSSSTGASNTNHRFQFRTLKIGEILHVRVLGGESMSAFYVAEISEFKIFRPHEQRQFTDHCKILPPATKVAVGDSVGIVKHQPQSYERAIVKNIIGQKALVRLIDWGTEDLVPINLLKLVNGTRFTAQPALALYCAANPNQVWYNNLCKFLYPGYEFKIKIVKPGHEFDTPNQVDLIKI